MVGKVVPLLAIEETEYKSREPAGYVNFVSKGDAVVEGKSGEQYLGGYYQ